MEFQDIRSYAEEIKSGFSERDGLYDKVEDAYLLRDVGLPQYDWIKPTISPDARNKTQGAARLLTATDPKWSVPRDKNKGDMDETIASQVEKAAAMIWAGSNRVRGKPVHYNAALAALLYGQVDIAVNVTKEIMEMESNPVRKKRIERALGRTPLLFEVLSPRICYPVYDSFGLVAHYTYRSMKVIDVIGRWGDKARAVMANKKMTDSVDYCEFWNEEFHSVWVSGAAEPIMHVEHGLTSIPIASATIEGGDMFEDEEVYQPFLYSTIKSHFHERQSLMLTLMFSTAFSTGATPLTVYKTGTPDKELQIDYSQPGGLIVIDNNESLEPLKREVIDRSMAELYQIAGEKVNESTIYGQTLGEPLGGNAPFSMVAMLSQSGRLPLVPYQRMLSAVITNAMGIGFDRLRQSGNQLSISKNDSAIDLNLKDIPENLELIATLDIEMPQDNMSDSRMAIELTKNNLISKERARGRHLQIEQSDEEDKQIMKEMIREIMLQNYVQQAVTQMQQQQPQMPQQVAPMMDPAIMQQMQQPPQQPPQGIDPLAQQAATEGMPMTEPLPPGGQPPEGGMPDLEGMIPGGM